MNIIIDCRQLYASGVGVYLRGILPFFFQSAHYFFLLGDSEKLYPYASNENAKIIPCDIKPFSLRELFFFPAKLKKIINNADIYYSPFFNIPGGVKIPVFLTIHDIIFADIPALASRAGLKARMWFFKRAYGKSSVIFTVSRFSKSRIERHLGGEKQIIVTYSAIQTIFLEYRKKIKNISKNKTIVFIGNIKKHKGLDCLLDAFTMARKEGLPHKLVIIGGADNFRTADDKISKAINSLGPEAVCFTGYLSDEKLLDYLAKASLLVQPSLYEGFCLPPLEAMVLGTRALISDIEVLREIYSDYPVSFFRAGDSVDLKNRMTDIINNNPSLPDLPDELLYKYTFEKTSKKILEALR